jgi:hypothetical protein
VRSPADALADHPAVHRRPGSSAIPAQVRARSHQQKIFLSPRPVIHFGPKTGYRDARARTLPMLRSKREEILRAKIRETATIVAVF